MGRISFKTRARRHQIKFREDVLKASSGDQDYHLCESDATSGLIFFNGFNIFDTARKRYPDFVLNKACYANMLRSEHIPFNFFTPFANDLEYAREVLNKFMGGIISEINVIKIEHAPDPEIALKDKTSFDVYIEYIHVDSKEGILGIEVKYTEKEYPLKEGSTEAKAIANQKHPYNVLTQKLGLYRKDKVEVLKTNEYRQVWRNQLMGESITRRTQPEFRFQHFTSIILFPEGNDHFIKLIPIYKSFFTPGHESSFMGITYEEFIETAREFTRDPEYKRWLQYLEDRYIVK